MPLYGRVAQYEQNIQPFKGLAESAATSNPFFMGDASMVVFSLISSSATASRWTLQGNEGDGFTLALAEAEWQLNKAVTAPGIYSVDTLSRWGRFQRTPSFSSMTLYVSIAVGP